MRQRLGVASGRVPEGGSDDWFAVRGAVPSSFMLNRFKSKVYGCLASRLPRGLRGRRRDAEWPSLRTRDD